MLVEPLKNDTEWENFAKITPGSTFCHSVKWKEVIERSFPLQTYYFTVRNDDGRLVGICPACALTKGNARVFDSLPFSDFGGPVVEKRQQEQTYTSLCKTIGEFCQENGISFAQICFMRDGYEKLFKSSRCYVSDGKGVIYLDLTSKPSDVVWKILASKQRQKIRKLEKNGFKVREAASKSDLKAFLNLYYQNMQHLGVPAFRPNLFENMWDLLYPENFTILFAETKEALGGGVAFFKYCKTIYLTYFGMDRDSLQHTPAVAPFLFWKAINWAEGNGFKTVCFGSTPAHPKNTREKANYSQKMAFGSSFRQQETIYVPFDARSTITFLIAPKAIRVWKSMRNVWPPKLRRVIQHQLGSMFEA
ncbi:MAG: GNAT family N-acetyltransferase [Candidatus Bathyarchaeia archaeon]|jgi:predicted N-acyltransferase